MCKTLPNASKVGQPGVLVPQLVLRKAGARHYRKYLYTYKKKKEKPYNHKEKKNTTSTAWYNNMPWNVIGFIIIYYNLKNVLLSTRDRKCFHLTYGKHAVIICTTKKKNWSLFFIHKRDDYMGIFCNGYFSSPMYASFCFFPTVDFFSPSVCREGKFLHTSARS